MSFVFDICRIMKKQEIKKPLDVHFMSNLRCISLYVRTMFWLAM